MKRIIFTFLFLFLNTYPGLFDPQTDDSDSDSETAQGSDWSCVSDQENGQQQDLEFFSGNPLYSLHVTPVNPVDPSEQSCRRKMVNNGHSPAKTKMLATLRDEVEDLDNLSFKIFEKALAEIEAMDKHVLNTPQKRVYQIFDKVYKLLTGQDISVFSSPYKKSSPQKVRKTMDLHKQIVKYIKEKSGSESRVLKLLQARRFQDYLIERHCEVALVDVPHIFQGDENGGGHVFPLDANERFKNEILELSRSVVCNETNGVIYAVDRQHNEKTHSTSIFPRNLSQEAIFSIIRGAKHFLCRQDNCVLLACKNCMIEMYMQKSDRLVKSAFPIFSYIDLSEFKPRSEIVIFKAKELKSCEPVELKMEYNQLVELINQLLVESIKNFMLSDHENIYFRYFKGDKIIVDIASKFSETTGIKNSLYVEISQDLIKGDVLSNLKAIFQGNSRPNLTSPFSNDSNLKTQETSVSPTLTVEAATSSNSFKPRRLFS